jgi:hypothetical protein
MAQHVDSNGIKALSVVSYDKIRGKLKTGDWFLLRVRSHGYSGS